MINARQALPGQGTVSAAIHGEYAQPPAGAGGPESAYARIVVKDTGAGIAPDVLPRIFEPWSSVNSAVGLGTGLDFLASDRRPDLWRREQVAGQEPRR